MKQKRLTLQEKLLFATPLLLLIGPILLLFTNREEEGLRRVMIQLSGSQAIDVNAAVANSHRPLLIPTIKAGKAFFFSSPYYEPTTSKNYLFGTVRTPQGELFDLCWEESPLYSLSHGKLNWIARVKHLKFMPGNQGYSHDGGNILSPEEQAILLKRSGAQNERDE
jgi:hypothetical protein